MQRSQFAKDTAGKKPAMLSLLCTTEKNYSLVGKKKKVKGENWAPFLMHHFLLFTTLCNPVRFAIVYVKNVFTECPCDADGHTHQKGT